MPWIRIDDHFNEHPKLAAVGPLGWAMWFAGLAYCNRNLTDGFIPWSVAQSLVSWEYLVDGERRSVYIGRPDYVHEDNPATCAHVIEILLVAGVWDVVSNGYQIHDYADYQPTKAMILAERAQKAASGAAGGTATARARATAGRQQDSSTRYSRTPAETQPNPNTNPVPVIEVEDKTARDERDCLDTFYELTMWRPWGQYSGDALKGATASFGDATVSTALRAEWTADKARDTLLKRTLTRLARDADRQRDEARTKPRTRKQDNAELMAESRKLAAEMMAAEMPALKASAP